MQAVNQFKDLLDFGTDGMISGIANQLIKVMTFAGDIYNPSSLKFIWASVSFFDIDFIDFSEYVSFKDLLSDLIPATNDQQDIGIIVEKN